MSIKTSLKVGLLTSALAAILGLTACEKKAEESAEQGHNADIPMSAEPAENNEPAIVADDLDEVDAQSEMAETGNDIEVDPSTSAIEDSSSMGATENAPTTDSQIGPEEGAVLEENAPIQ